jgi:hypothetical protein
LIYHHAVSGGVVLAEDGTEVDAGLGTQNVDSARSESRWNVYDRQIKAILPEFLLGSPGLLAAG